MESPFVVATNEEFFNKIRQYRTSNEPKNRQGDCPFRFCFQYRFIMEPDGGGGAACERSSPYTA
jgi:hypothetical protein